MVKKARALTKDEILAKQEQYQKELEKRLTPIESLESMELNNVAQKIRTDIITATKKICSTSQKTQ